MSTPAEIIPPPQDAAPTEQTPAAPQALVPSAPRAVATREPMAVGERGIMIRSFEDLQRFAKMALESGAVPKGMETIGQVAVAIQAGMEAGLTPMNALQAIVVINGVTSWRGQSAVGLVRAHPLCLYIRHWTEGEGDEMRGVCVSARRGAGREERSEFTVRQAKKAGLWNKKGPWTEYADRQVMWRAVGFHCKDHWSDVLGGFPIAEEAMDIPQAAVVRPAPALSSPPSAPPLSPDPLLTEGEEFPASHEEADRSIAESEAVG